MKVVELFVPIVVVLSLALLLAQASDYIVPQAQTRKLAEFYLYAAYNPFHLSNYTAMTPAVVSAIVWDFRGLDTLFETMVFYLALIAGIALCRGTFSERMSVRSVGLSVIVKTVTKITAPMILTVGASIGLHGHLTPGGGFQGGSVIAVVPMLFIVIFSITFLIERGITTGKALTLRTLGLAGIGLTAVVLFMAGLVVGQHAYVFQSIAKPNAPLSMPRELSGTVWFFNLFEMIAVAAGFSMAFIIIILSRFSARGG
ncbi:MAG: MnhB domain-containing protein [Desulfurococcaceae archaeon]